MVECSTCFNVLPDVSAFQGHETCGVAMCRACWRLSVEAALSNNGAATTFPCAGCTVPLDRSLCLALLDDAWRERLARWELARERISLHADIWNHVRSSPVRLLLAPLLLPACYFCRLFVPTRTQMYTLLWTKPCPNCAVRIEKASGCAHMVCTACQSPFCWTCGAHGAGRYYGGHMCSPLMMLRYSGVRGAAWLLFAGAAAAHLASGVHRLMMLAPAYAHHVAPRLALAADKIARATALALRLARVPSPVVGAAAFVWWLPNAIVSRACAAVLGAVSGVYWVGRAPFVVCYRASAVLLSSLLASALHTLLGAHLFPV